jgi:predicted nucleotidyltransferase
LSHDRKVKRVHDHTGITGMDALSLLRQHEPILKKQFGVSKIGIFGSFVRGEERPESDVDVLVTFKKGQETFDHYMDCKFYLEDLFGRKVDLVMKGAIKPRLREYILGEVVYA